MFSKLRIIGILLIVKTILSRKENNSTSANITSSKGHLNKEIGCVPLEKWSIMNRANDAAEVACMTKDYEIGNEPKEISRNPILIAILDRTIVDIGEKKKRITVEMGLRCTWQDERIGAVFAKNVPFFRLPPVTTEEKPLIWNPFLMLEIKRLKKRRYILDPIVARTGLGNTKTVNGFLKHFGSSKIFSRHISSVVWSDIEWRITVSCPFDFQNFPFDEHECHLTMVLPFKWNLTVYNDKNYTANYDADGFEIITHNRNSFRGTVLNLGLPYCGFSFDFHMKRQISTYIFQYYLPSITIVIASSVSFIIPLSAIPGRVALVVTQFLTLTNIFIHQMTESPSAATLTSLGRYLLTSLIFVFFTIAEFALVLIFKEGNEQKLQKINVTTDKTKSEKVSFRQPTKLQQINVNKVSSIQETTHNLARKKDAEEEKIIFRILRLGFFANLPLTRKLDVIAFVIYHLSYLFFNLYYWNSLKNKQ